MLPFVVALVITLDAYPWLPPIQVATYATERECNVERESAVDAVVTRFPIRKLYQHPSTIDYHWSCKQVTT